MITYEIMNEWSIDEKRIFALFELVNFLVFT